MFQIDEVKTCLFSETTWENLCSDEDEIVSYLTLIGRRPEEEDFDPYTISSDIDSVSCSSGEEDVINTTVESQL